MGATALMLACANGREALVAKLLELGASTDAKRADGSTPLMIAALGAHRGVVRQLVMHRRPPTFNYDAITKPIAGVSEYALEFRASGRWRSAPTLTPAGGSAVAGRTSPTSNQESALTIIGTLSGGSVRGF
jgi:ankyrin repeat protein